MRKKSEKMTNRNTLKDKSIKRGIVLLSILFLLLSYLYVANASLTDYLHVNYEFDTLSYNDSLFNFNCTPGGDVILNNTVYKTGTQSVQFKGTAPLLNCGFVPFLNESKFTVNFWVYLPEPYGSDGKHQIEFCKFNTVGTRANPIYNSHLDKDDSDKFQILLGDGSTHSALGGAENLSINTFAWYMYTVKWEGGQTYSIYINGVKKNTYTSAQALGEGATYGLYLGGCSNGLNGYMRGLLDSFSIWGANLSNTDISNLYNSGAGLEYPFNLPEVPAQIPQTVINVNPANNTIIEGNNTLLSYKVYGTNSSYNCSLYLNNTKKYTNTTTLNNTETFYYLENAVKGSYKWFANCSLNSTYFNSSGLFTLTFNDIKINVSAFGDSITAGSVIGVTNAFPYKLNQTGKYRVFNKGVDGEGSYDLLQRMSDVINKSQKTIVYIGVNDLDTSQPYSTTLDEYYLNMLNITQQILNNNQTVLLSFLHPINESAYNVTENNLTLIKERNRVIAKVSDQLNACYSDIFTDVFNQQFNVSLMEDNVHINAFGHNFLNTTYYNDLTTCKTFDCSLNISQCYNTTTVPPINVSSNTTIYVNTTLIEYLLNKTYMETKKNSGGIEMIALIILVIAGLLMTALFSNVLFLSISGVGFLMAGILNLVNGMEFQNYYYKISGYGFLFIGILFFLIATAGYIIQVTDKQEDRFYSGINRRYGR